MKNEDSRPQETQPMAVFCEDYNSNVYPANEAHVDEMRKSGRLRTAVHPELLSPPRDEVWNTSTQERNIPPRKRNNDMETKLKKTESLLTNSADLDPDIDPYLQTRLREEYAAFWDYLGILIAIALPLVTYLYLSSLQ